MNIYKIKPAAFGIAIIMLGIMVGGCSPFNRTQRGASIGAGAGATVGAVIGKTAGNVALGAIIGGAVGGTAGAYIAHQMGNQPGNLKSAIPGAKVVSLGDDLYIKFTNAILFAPDSTDLKDQGQKDVVNLTKALQENPQLNITIIGHADSLETIDPMALSLKRAQTVKEALVSAGVNDSRLTAIAKGTTEPVAYNSTEEGRAKNRRVAILINKNIKYRAAKNNH
ncbi:OmpA family protein [Mucilaginibacter sp. E4BP6]|uniref:OmpA family protein n=1 Tax=Mucilaginibacter sp. E4BP6 TaxID=2723089 RepID=UPI0015CC0D3A|nr:OmpA family protein [Mucilaginibacter sp. E4BP6]NYE68441.1 outer membrane protein OmpA-like peptidoglycan-associated protein [Mucilaginibacter sp. E4BP6]